MTVAFNRDGSRVLSASHDRTARLWEVAPAPSTTVLRGHVGNVGRVAFSADGARLLSVADNTQTEDMTARVWDSRTGRELAVLRCTREPSERTTATANYGQIFAASLTPDGSAVLGWAAGRGGVRWDLSAGAEKHLHSQKIGASTGGHDFSPDCRRIASGMLDSTVRVRDALTGEELVVFRGHTGGAVAGVAFSPDGRWVASGGEDRTARIWDAATGAERLVLGGHTGTAHSLAFDATGERVATADFADHRVRLWDATTGALLAELMGDAGWVNSIVFSPDGRRVATGTADKTVRVWDAGTGTELAALRGFPTSVKSIAFSPDGTVLAVASGNEIHLLGTAPPPVEE